MADICGSEGNPNLTYLVVVSDAVHLGKTYKSSWGSGFLFLVKVTEALLQHYECCETTPIM